MLRKIIQQIKIQAQNFDRMHRNKLIEWHKKEELELRNNFALLTGGGIIGLPAPPLQISLELLPLIEDDLKIMLERMGSENDALAELFSDLDIG